MGKPTYYLWLDDFHSQTDFENTKDRYIKMGFRVVTFREEKQDGDIQGDIRRERGDSGIQEGIMAVIKNHIFNSGNLQEDGNG